MPTNPDRQALLHLSLIEGLGPILIRRLLEKFGDAASALHATHAELRMVEGIGPKRARDIQDQIQDLDVSGTLLEMEQRGIGMIAITDDDYPLLLKNIHDPPPVLYIRGQLLRHDALSLAIVGARKCTAYGRDQALRFGTLCAQSGLTIISGGAWGIDAAAHRGALRAGGRTVAVLGCGLAECYPPDHGSLFDEIAEHGAVLSELPLHTPPRAENFPARNRIVSGLSLGVLVIEAARRSGALITARLANDDHQRDVMALPGRVDSPMSDGCHRILREGWASLVTNAADVLDALGEAGQILKEQMNEAQASQETTTDDHLFSQSDEEPSQTSQGSLPPEQQRIIQALGSEPITLDEVAHTTGLPIHRVQAELTTLQLTGQIERLPGNQIKLKR